MSVKSFRKYCQTHGLSEETVCSTPWLDAEGRRWSAMGRLGYLQFTSGAPCRNDGLLAYLSTLTRPDPGPSAWPNDDDMLWAWLGHTTFSPERTSSSQIQSMMARFPTTSTDMPAAGLGVGGDGGWLDKALTMVEQLSKTQGTPALALNWLANLLSANLLAGPAHPHMRVWGLTGSPPPWPVADMDALPRPSHQTSPLPRPRALVASFDEALARHLDLMSTLVRNSAVSSPNVVLHLGFSSKGDTLDLARFMGHQSRRALVGLLESVCDTPSTQPVWGMLVPVLAAVAALGDETPLSAGLLARVKTDLQRQAYTLPGEPPGTVWDWGQSNASPQLHAWIYAHRLDEQLPPAKTSASPKARM